jgi:pimeloyl-ACP methyl ester carboxylesterase
VLQIVDRHTPIRTSYWTVANRRNGRRGALACARVTIAYDRLGSGPPLLLVHGLGSCKEMWRPLLPALAREREVVAVDMPGFGASPPGPRTVEELADALSAFVAELGLERPHVAGNSLGGGVALTMGAAGAARSVCALSPIGFLAGREKAYGRAVLAGTRRLAERLDPVAPRLARSAVMRTLLSSHAAARPWRIPPQDTAHWTRMYAQAPAFWDLLEALDGWRAPVPACPTTIAWGERDRLLIFSRQAPRARRVMPQARHVVLRGCGHVPTWDDPDQVAHVLLSASRPAEAPRRSAPGYSSPSAPRP